MMRKIIIYIILLSNIIFRPIGAQWLLTFMKVRVVWTWVLGHVEVEEGNIYLHKKP